MIDNHPALREPKLVIFDCDGVLVDSEPLAAEAMRNVYGMRGLGIELSHVAAGIGMKQADILDLIEAQSGHRLPQDALEDLWPETRRLFAERLVTTPGAASFIESLQIPVCVASSSTPERIAFSLEKTGLRKYFGNDLFSSTMVRHGKPAPDLFLLAADKMGVEPRHCLVIEDSPYGVEGALAAGMAAIGYTGGLHADERMIERLSHARPHLVMDSWAAIRLALIGQSS